MVGYRNADGSANLSGYNLPLDRVAAASGHIDALAKAAKRAGDCRPIDHIRADLFLGMTDGTYTGLDDSAIIELLTAAPTPGADHPDSGSDDNQDHGEPDGNGPDDGGLDDKNPDVEGPDSEEEASDCGSPMSGALSTRPVRAAVGAGVELRVRLSTLLGHDQYPAELAGWGPVHAELARELAATLGGAQWRFAITDEHGHLTHCGITQARTSSMPARRATCRAIVELQVPATALCALAADPTTPHHWAAVVADLTRQLYHDNPSAGRGDADAARRTPGAGLRRYLEIRDRYCTMIGCRAPAHTADKDHTIDHAQGGPTIGSNLGDNCRHDHRLKGEGGWALHQPEPGVFQWTTVDM